MALWKEQAPGSAATPGTKDPLPREPERPAAVPISQERRPRERSEPKESVLASDLTIEGKIEGAGHVRIAGKFKGDVNVQGNVTIDAGAHLTGQVRAHTVTVGGELHGNIEGDVMWPALDERDWVVVERESHSADERHAYAMTFEVWEKR